MNAAKIAAALPALLSSIPGPQRRLFGLIMDAAGGAELIGPPDPPAAFQRLFEAAAAAHDLAPELLAAVAAVLTDYDPDRPDGIMGLDGGDYGATLEELQLRDPDALERVRSCVQNAATAIAQLHEKQGSGLAGAIYTYAQRHYNEMPATDRVRRTAGEIVGTFAILAARRLPAERRGKIGELVNA